MKKGGVVRLTRSCGCRRAVVWQLSGLSALQFTDLAKRIKIAGMDSVEKEIMLQSSSEGVLRLYEASDTDIENIPEELERSLLQRDERLIDLALAQYSHNEKIIADLFSRGIRDDDETLRLACLKTKFRPWHEKKFPYFLFGSKEDEKFAEYFRNQITIKEIRSIGKGHPDKDFIFSFLERGSLWDLFASNRPMVFYCLVSEFKEMGLNRSHDAFLAIQRMLLNVPVSNEWRDAFREVRWSVEPRSYEYLDEVIERWTEGSQVLETYSADYEIQYFLFKCKFVSLTHAEIKKYLRDEDIAIRHAAYASYGNFSKSDIREMYRRDGEDCLNVVKENESFWRSNSNREELGELCNRDHWLGFREAMKEQPGYDYNWTENKEDGRRRKIDYWSVIAGVIFFIWLIFF